MRFPEGGGAGEDGVGVGEERGVEVNCRGGEEVAW